jgi:hemerythrin
MDWLDRYHTGVVELDREHLHFQGLVLPIDGEACRTWSTERFQAMIAEIGRFAQQHFHTEERLMEASGYIDSAPHIEEHDKMARKIRAFAQQAETGGVDVASLRAFLDDWLWDHARSFDKPLALHVSRVQEELRQG